MTFIDSRLPDDVEKGAIGGPQFHTTVASLSSGHEQRNINWSQTRAKYNISYGIQRKSEMAEVINFFYACRGQAYGFRFKDWADYQMTLQPIGLGDGSNKVFQAIKSYAAGSAEFIRTITKLVEGTVTVYVEGIPVSCSIDYSTGVITLDNAPAGTGGSGPGGEEIVSMTGEFDVPVRFNSDELNITMEIWDAGTVPIIELVEIR